MWEVRAEFPGCYAGDGFLSGVWGIGYLWIWVFVWVELGADLEEVGVGSPGGCGEFCHCGLVVQEYSKQL